MSTVGVVGLGRIGGGLVRTLARARGDDLVGFDPNPDALAAVAAQARAAGSAREAADGSEVVFIAVYDDAQVRSALSGADGVLSAQRLPRAIVILSTVEIGTIEWAAAAAADHGVAVLDCGVTGGGAIEEGQIAAMIGGDRDAYDVARPFIEGFASPALYMGPLGSGMKAKLARNLIVFGSWYVAGEAARLAAAAGVDVNQLVEASDAGDRWSGGVTALLKRGVQPPGGPRDDADLALRQGMMGYARKDVAAALALAAELGVELPAAGLVVEHFGDAVGLDSAGH